MGRFMPGAGKRHHHSVPRDTTSDPGESGQFIVGEHDHTGETAEEQTLGGADHPDSVAPESRADAWTTCSSAYQAFAAGLTRPFAWDAVRLVRIETGSRVLDVATGTGEFAIAAAARGADVLATDFSASMLELVETSRRRPPVGTIQTALMDGQALALDSHAFDAAGSLFGLVFFPNPAQGLSEMYRVLKPGGQAVIATWAIPAHVELMRIVGDALMQLDSELPERASPESCWTSLSSPRRLTQLMADAGFSCVHVVALGARLDFRARGPFRPFGAADDTLVDGPVSGHDPSTEGRVQPCARAKLPRSPRQRPVWRHRAGFGRRGHQRR